MDIKELNKTPNIEQNIKLNRRFMQFEKLIDELKTKELPDEIVEFINTNIDEINSSSNSEKELKKKLKKAQSRIIRLVVKELKIVTKNHYRNFWSFLVAGIGFVILSTYGTSFGIIGTVIGFLIGRILKQKKMVCN